jgi:hypothetical protein
MTSAVPEDPALGMRLEEEMLTMLGEERLARLTAKVKDLRARFLARREKWKVTLFKLGKYCGGVVQTALLEGKLYDMEHSKVLAVVTL